MRWSHSPGRSHAGRVECVRPTQFLDALLRVVAQRVERSLPAPGETAAPAPRPGKPLHLGKARAVRAPGLGQIETRRVAVLPPESFADDVRAAGIVAHLLAIRLRDAGFEPVEAADLREALTSRQIDRRHQTQRPSLRQHAVHDRER